jgi:hypothetical protein
MDKSESITHAAVAGRRLKAASVVFTPAKVEGRSKGKENGGSSRRVVAVVFTPAWDGTDPPLEPPPSPPPVVDGKKRATSAHPKLTHRRTNSIPSKFLLDARTFNSED